MPLKNNIIFPKKHPYAVNKKVVKINFGPLDNGLFRLRGFSGLGNLLCTWGEAMLLAKRDNLQIVWPTWPQLSLSALKYKRTYFKVFRTNGLYIPIWKYYMLLASFKLSKRDIIQYGPKTPYNVEWEHSDDPIEDANWLYKNLLAIVAPKYLKRANNINRPEKFIGIHIRRGDFLNPIHHFKDGGGREVNKAIELKWFINAIGVVRSSVGDLPVICISDAHPDELSAILAIKNVRLQCEHPIVDLLTISKADAFIASGSTFSQWIAYLGQMDTWINKGHTWYSPSHLNTKVHQI